MKRFLRRLLRVAIVLVVLGAVAAGVLTYLLFERVGEARDELRPQVEALRAFKLVRPGWAFTARVYTDWYEFGPGRGAGIERLEREAVAREYKKVEKDPQVGEYTRKKGELVLHLRGFDFPDGAAKAALVRVTSAKRGDVESVERLAGDAWPVPWRLEPLFMDEWIPENNEIRRWVPMVSIPKAMRDAVVASEDARFYEHDGVDPKGIARAAWRNFSEAEKAEGASTLTQQVVRTFFLTREKSYRRKIAEAVRAMALEDILEKDEILELYLNSVYFGQQPDGRSVGGVAAAARAYFDVDVADLTLDQAALLAGILPSPVAWSPWKNPEMALKRRERVLTRMVELGLASRTDADAAAVKPLALKQAAAPVPRWPLYSLWARRFLTQAMGEDPAARGLRVFTALDPALQEDAEQGVTREVKVVEEEYGYYKADPLQGAVVGVDPSTGLVPFAVSGRGREGDQFHRAVQAKRQPGSAIKPIAYAAVLSEKTPDGQYKYTPAHIVEDKPRAFETKEGPWRPRNSDGLYHPWVSIAKAFAKSMNVATTNLVVDVGPEKVVEMGRKLGIDSEMRPVPSVGLGSSEVTLVELVGALAAVATVGKRVDPSPVHLAVDRLDQAVWTAPAPTDQVLDPVAAAMLQSLMRNSYVRGTGYMARRELSYVRDVVGKTGTSQMGRDIWFVGVSPRLAVGFWMGHDRRRPLNVIAGDVIAPAWGRMARPLFNDTEMVPFPVPDGVEEVTIDPYSGCKGGGFPVLMPKGQPFPKCKPIDWEIPRRVEKDGEGGEPAEGGEPPPESATP